MVRFSPNGSKLAYTAIRGRKGSIWINDTRVSLEFEGVAFTEKLFKKTGELIFAGYDKEKHEILYTISLVEVK